MGMVWAAAGGGVSAALATSGRLSAAARTAALTRLQRACLEVIFITCNYDEFE
jgi:hypothetical protein